MKNLNKYYILFSILAAMLILFGGFLGVIAGIYIFALIFKHSKQVQEEGE
ncbi:hypothetical protein R2F61_03365 [Mollicutes bacterium LVI A0078]|nr:hypothetical protein RZE84_03395 [Mollicutes bacterium LVI A0075]WOO91603.1 hypothetical protein R2F61_03365 [Mollicutes bacterium LVI A0078]